MLKASAIITTKRADPFLLYVGWVKVYQDNSDIPAYRYAGITHCLKQARRMFSGDHMQFEKIHGTLVNQRPLPGHCVEMTVKPFGAKIVDGEVYVTGNEKDKLPLYRFVLS